LGLNAPEQYPVETDNNLSLEGLVEMNPDYIFLSADSEVILQSYEDNSVWNSISAVKSGEVYSFDLSGLTGGPLSIKYGIQTVLETLTN
jgi:iron complex transport system substrate-binding protein